MSMPPSRLISASAGSGKTYALTTHFLALLGCGEDPASICAITFTRAAAGEILERLCQRLVDAIEHEDRRADISRDLGWRVSCDDARAMLRWLLDSLDRLNISTIDALLHRLATASALGLDFPPAWGMLEPEQDEWLREQALEHAMSSSKRGELSALIEALIGKPSLSPRQAVLKVMREAAHRVRGVPGEEPWESLRPRLQPLSDEQLGEAIDALERMNLPLTKSGKPRISWQKAVASLVESLRNRRYDDAIKMKLVQRALEEYPKFDRVEMDADHLRCLRPIARHLRAIVLHRVYRRSIALRDLAHRYLESEDTLKRGHRLLRFDDIPPLLVRADVMGNLPELGERLDLSIRHLLLDEFQDTSIIQLRLLLPVLDEILSSDDGRTCLIVGDAKQSLYTWRDAEPGLLRAVGERYQDRLEHVSLDLSYRSSQVVLNAVNQVFGTLQTNNALHSAPEAARVWQERFHAHRAARQIDGQVRLIETPAADGNDEDRPHLAVCVGRVCEIRERAPWASIGIIVRTNKAIRPIVDALRRRGIAASEEGGSTLCDTRPVACAIALLRLALHPLDNAARMLVGTSPLGPAVGLLDPLDERQGTRIASQVRAQVARHGLAPWLVEIRERLASSMVEEEHARFEQLIDLAGAFDAGTSPRLEAFLEMVDTRKIDLPSMHPVRVMTAHHAKGLEFDAVILCELDGSIEPKERGLILERTDPLGPVSGATRVPTKDELPFCDQRLRQIYDAHRQRCIEEALCVLYVAMTRARRSLDMIIAPPPKDPGAITHAWILREALAGEPSEEDDDSGVLFSLGDDSWMDATREEDPEPAPRAVEIRLRSRGRRPSARLSMRAASRPSGPPTPAAILRPTGETGAQIGSIVHALFERVAWIEDFEADDDDLLQVARAVSPEHAQAGLELFRRALQSESLAHVLSRPKGECELWRERPFVVRIEEPTATLVSGRFDRVHVFREEGRAMRAMILDFKTDREDEASLRERYHAQMDTYRLALAQMLDLPSDCITCALVAIPEGTIIEMNA